MSTPPGPPPPPHGAWNHGGQNGPGQGSPGYGGSGYGPGPGGQGYGGQGYGNPGYGGQAYDNPGYGGPGYSGPGYGGPGYSGPGYGPPGYPAPGYGEHGQPPAPQPRTSGFAVAALLCGIFAVVPLALIFGVVALGRTKPGAQQGRGMAIVGMALAGLWAVAALIGIIVAVGLFGSGTIAATQIRPGDCIAELPDGDRVLALRTVDCSQLHAGEVVANLTVPGDTFPGTDTILDYQDRCPDAVFDYAPSAQAVEGVGVYALYPTEETWASGDRVVSCLATFDPMITGSIRE